MKTTFKYIHIVVSAAIIFSMLIMSCDSSRTGPVLPVPPVPVEPTAPLMLKGTVLDAADLSGIAGAQIFLNKTDGTRIAALVTTAGGKYQYDVTSLSTGQIAVVVNAPSYGSTSAKAEINQTAYTASVPDLYLKKIVSVTETVTATTGGEISAVSQESSSGVQLNISIPANALQQNTAITVASVPVNNTVPLTASTNQVLASVANLTPSGLTFAQPVTVTFPLPYTAAAGKVLKHYKLNETTLVWEVVGNAPVNADGKSANVQLMGFSSHSVGDDGSVVQSGLNDTQADGAEVLLSGGESSSQTYTPALTLSNSELGNVWAKRQIASLSGMRINDNGDPLAMTVTTPTVTEPELPSDKKRTGTDGVVYHYNSEKPDEAGKWVWKGVYQRFLLIYSFTISLGGQSGTAAVTMKEYRKVRDNYTWVPEHNQGG